MKTQKIVITNPDVAIKLTSEEATMLGIDTNLDEQRGDLKTFGVWNIPISYKALCVSAIYDRETHFYTVCTEMTFYGQRTMNKIRQSGYELEGYVSVNGKKYTCFTSSQMFEVNGKLISVATIHARIR